MKLRQLPSDFIVEEISNFTPEASGKYFVYKLEKRSISTMEALELIARQAGVRTKALSASGLKDKHSESSQLFSSDKPLPSDVKDERITLSFVGKSARPLTAGFIDENKFKLVLRGLDEQESEAVSRNAHELREFGVPNYYDNQRFGSNVHGQGFIAKALVQGRYEEALRLHMAVPHRKQSMRDKQNRRLANLLWGQWTELHKQMKRCSEAAIVEFLRDNPGKFMEAFERITPPLRIMYVAAYQSLIFNETVRRFLEAEKAAGTLELWSVQNRAGYIPMYRSLTPAQLGAWREALFPILGPRTDLDATPLAAPHVRSTLKEEGITQEQLNLTGMERTRFKGASRKLLLMPKDLDVGPVVPDDLNEGRCKVETSFTLPRGCFATIVARRLVLL
ncbi:tRNA pseudouridine synthase D [Planctomycetaceae bacterium]|nr:tRNA pseudouridine synthase D [Planctomycetaceae bacterium]